MDSRISPTNRLHISTTDIYPWHSRYLVMFSGWILACAQPMRDSHWLGTSLESAPSSLRYDNMRSKITTRVIFSWLSYNTVVYVVLIGDPKQYGISIFLCGYFVGKKTVKPDGILINKTINPSKIAILFAASFNIESQGPTFVSVECTLPSHYLNKCMLTCKLDPCGQNLVKLRELVNWTITPLATFTNMV